MDTAVIVAGGRGTRIAEHFPDLPKAMIPVGGRTILEHQIQVLKREGITRFFISIGYLGHVIQDFLGDGSRFGVRVEYLIEDKPLGTGGGLFDLRGTLTEDFFLCLGDVIFDLDLSRLLRFHQAKNSQATLVLHPNSHAYDSDVVLRDEDDRVVGWLPKKGPREQLYRNMVNSGLYVFSPALLDRIPGRDKLDLEKDLILGMIRDHHPVYGYHTTEYLKDAGTPDRLESVTRALESGLVASRNLSGPQQAVFLDRDGTLNVFKGLISNHLDLDLEPDAIPAVKRLNASPYLAVVVTNQPVIARNLCDLEELDRIHSRLDMLLAEGGAFLDGLYFCPHHPDSGYPEERTEYKIPCTCRKPGPGMLLEARDRFNIDLSRSWIIGDSARDVQTGAGLGLRTILLDRGESLREKDSKIMPDHHAADLAEAVDIILGGSQ